MSTATVTGTLWNISSAGYALASDNCSILLSRLIHLANIRFLWIIVAAEELEPGAHANGASVL